MPAYDYTIQGPGLGQQFLGGFGQGQQLMAQQKAQERQAEMQNDLAMFSQNKNKTVADYEAMMQKYPELQKTMQASLDRFTSQQKENKINQLMSFYAPLKSGNVDAAKSRLDELIDAYKNSGNDLEAQNMQTIRDNIDIDPNGAVTSSELFLFQSMDPERFKKFAESQGALGEEKRAAELQPEQIKLKKAEVIKAGLDAGLTEQEAMKVQAQTKNMDAETQKIFMEMESLQKTGGLTPDKRFDMEQKLSDKYYKRSEDYLERRVSFDNLLESAKDASGAGDYALVKSFEKMLEPGSAVLDGEFAKAQAASGKLSQMLNTFRKFTEGTTFESDTQRQYYVNLAKKYMQSSERYDETVRKDLRRQIDRYGLDPGLLPEKRAIPETDLAKIKSQQKTPPPAAAPPPSESVKTMTSQDLVNTILKGTQ